MRRYARIAIDRGPDEPWPVYGARCLGLAQAMRCAGMSLVEADRVERLALAALAHVQGRPEAATRVAELLEHYQTDNE